MVLQTERKCSRDPAGSDDADLSERKCVHGFLLPGNIPSFHRYRIVEPEILALMAARDAAI
ncbi:MAG: hypothetical protein AB7E24_25525 [Novosphingobium sp.]